MTHMAETILKSWHTLNKVLHELREDQVKELIWWEMEHKKRPDVMVRLHQRFTKLAAERERKELLELLEKLI